MAVTFTIGWVDQYADFVSVKFSDNPNNAVSIPVVRSSPVSWQQQVSDWYRANLTKPVAADSAAVRGVTLPILPPTN